ncbi:MAG: rod shape-determining protein MreC [Candidatus Pacebacteria bacterium]|nr:rod shape-determining protein MreC [Candidatus Paceibacterota bacterium]
MTIIIRRDKKRKTRKMVTLFVVSAFLVYGILLSPMAPFFSGLAHTAATPFWKAGAAFSETLSPFLSYFSSRRELYLENKELKVQVGSMVAKVSDRDLLRKENEELKEMLGRNNDRERILAVVLARSDQTLYDTLIIDVGEKHEVKKDNIVISENVVVGKIEEVFQDSSKVVLFSTAGKEQVVVVGSGGPSSNAKGLGGGNFEIQLPKNSGVSVGDTIYLPDIEPRIFGVVERVESGTTDAFERILFKSPVNPFMLSKVEVVL